MIPCHACWHHRMRWVVADKENIVSQEFHEICGKCTSINSSIIQSKFYGIQDSIAMYLELMEGIFYMNLCKTEFHICKFPVEFSIPGVGEFTLWWRSWQYSFPYIHSFEMLFLIVYSVSYILVAVFFDKDHHSDDAGDRHQGSIKWSALGHENSLNVMNPDHRAEQS